MISKIKIPIILIACIFISASCSATPESFKTQPPGPQNQISNRMEKIHPTSIEYLEQKEFDGRDLTLGKILSDNQYYTRYFITYKSGELNISGILNVPKGQMPERGWPVLFLNHGHIDTAIYTNGRGLRREQDYLAKQGFAVLHSDYRNHAQSDKDPNEEYNFRLGYTEDVINAVLAVKKSEFDFLSKSKFGMLGHSMGGGITQNVLVIKPELIKAAVLYAPVSGKAADSFERWTTKRPEIARVIAEKYGLPNENPEFWNNISAETFFEKISRPMLYFHGTADKDVPIEWSQNTVKLLQSLNKKAELVEYPLQPHEFTSPIWDKFMGQTAEFFTNNL